MKCLVLLGLLASLVSREGLACSMTALSGTTYLIRSVSEYVSRNSPLEASVDRIELRGTNARVQFTSGEGLCYVKTFQVTIDRQCSMSVAPISEQLETCPVTD